MGQLIQELKRRNVIRVAIAYAVAAWLLIEVTSTIFPILSLPAWSVTLVTVLLLIGLPLVLVFSWAYEITPEGIKKEKDVDRSEPVTRETARKLDIAVIVLLLLAIGSVVADRLIPDATTLVTEQTADNVGIASASDRSIAVLPFVNMSSDPEQEYFSDGISEELLNVLSKIPGLQVTARTSSFQFKGENRDVIDIGRQLNAALVLEGSVRKAGPQIRITAQLIDAKNGFHLWSESYDRELENIFAVQDEISAAIVMALTEHLGLQVEAAPRTIAAANTEAHDAYLRGRHLVVQRTQTTVEGAVGEFEKAVALDPNYAVGHAELAIATLFLTQYGDLTVTEAVAKATPHVERAMVLDPTLAEAHAAAGYALRFQENAEEALPHFRNAIQINPNYAIVYNAMGVLLGSFLGHYDQSSSAYETALRLDPLSIPAIMNYAGTLIARNRLVEADRELEKLAAIAPGRYASELGDRMSLGGKWANAVLGGLDALRLQSNRPRTRNDLTWAFATLRLEKEALAISEDPPPSALSWLGKHGDAVTAAEARVVEESVSFNAHRDLGLALASAGDYARARPILEEMWQRSGGRVTPTGRFQIASAAALIAVRRDAGKEAEIGELVAAMRDDVRRYREAGKTRTDRFSSVDYEEGLAAYLVGEYEKGLTLIAKGAEDGFFIQPNEAYLQTLYDDPGFAPIRASQEARQKRERDKFLAIVCADNPYEAVWQPAEGTCDEFAAASAN